MQVPTDGTHPVADTPAQNTPLTLERPTNIYDDPFAAFINSGTYKALIFLLSCQSSSVMIFLRYRIGLRLVRMWIFVTLFVLLGGYGFLFGGGLLFLFSGGDSASQGTHSGLIPFAFIMLGMALYRNAVAKELVEHPTQPLHTMARGDSYLTRVLSHMPVVRGYAYHFTTRHVYRPQIFPLQERAVQSLVEPLVAILLGVIMTVLGYSGLGFWLVLAGITLRMVEEDYYIRGQNAYYDRKDAQIEAKVTRAINDPNYRNEAVGNTGKIGGIAVVSEDLRQMRLRRLQSQG